MNIRIEVNGENQDDEIIIRCSELNNEVKRIQEAIAEVLSQKAQISFFKNETEYYISLEDILFFETEEATINAHTIKDMYQVKYKLYELEEILPKEFVRVSKSTIVNINYIHSITRNLTSSSIIEFKNTHKKVYVSRHYYKQLKVNLLEKRR
ncbi:MAG: LytTR family DNA-binding domain-containing protein [Clostridium sp.]